MSARRTTHGFIPICNDVQSPDVKHSLVFISRLRNGLPSDPSFSYQNVQQAGPRYAGMFPCQNPTSPMYSDYSERLRTYSNWPKGHVMKPELLADAGLFFLGDRDRSKCFYCNGGLQNWERGDNAMEEHAKYFPQCEYVLARMGLEYVAELNERFPNLKRPTISVSSYQTHHHEPQRQPRPALNDAPLRLPAENMQTSNIPQGQACSLHNTHVPSLPQTESDSSMQGCNQIERLKLDAEQFGYDRSTIDRIVVNKLANSGTYHSTLTELIEDLILDTQGDLMEVEYTAMATEPAVSVAKPNHVGLSTNCNNVESDSLRDQLQNAIDETLCKSCHKRNRDCVFLDCGHLCCCYECGETKKSCVICNARITSVIKIFKM